MKCATVCETLKSQNFLRSKQSPVHNQEFTGGLECRVEVAISLLCTLFGEMTHHPPICRQLLILINYQSMSFASCVAVCTAVPVPQLPAHSFVI
jgi:hypothetical protein